MAEIKSNIYSKYVFLWSQTLKIKNLISYRRSKLRGIILSKGSGVITYFNKAVVIGSIID